MNPTVLGGLLLTVLAIVVSTLIDGNSLGALVGPSSFVLVFFATLGATAIGYDLADLKALPKVVLVALRGRPPDLDLTVTALGGFAEVARREGVLALERRLPETDDEFVRKGLQLVVDGIDADEVREIMEIDIAALAERHQTGISLSKTLGGYAPTMGMIGTVIGLINMLGNLSDPSQLGIGMALALLTTLYGVMFANLLFLPLNAKLTRLNTVELSARDVALDGILAIQAGASPRLLIERLETYLPPGQRIGYQARMEASRAAPGTPAADAAEAAA